MRLPAVFALLLLFGLAACGGSRPVETDGGEDNRTDPSGDAASHPAYETFDPSAYDSEPVTQGIAIAHDVPDTLMQGRVPAPVVNRGTPRFVQGFRIQVFSSADKNAADRWWRSVRENAPTSMQRGFPIVVDYNRPYYRVRVGLFYYRNEAQEALGWVQGRFGEAFVVPDRVPAPQR